MTEQTKVSEVEQDRVTFHCYASAIGGMVGLLIVPLIASHIMFHFTQTFHSSLSSNRRNDRDKERYSKCLYVLFLCICASCLITFVPYCFLKSNMITQQSAESISTTQCACAYFVGMAGSMTMQMLAHVFLIHRLQLMFSCTVYRFPKMFIHALYASIAVVAVVTISLVLATWPYTHFLHKAFGKDGKYTYCGVDKDEKYGSKQLMDSVAIGLFMVAQIVYYLIDLYMFVSRMSMMRKVQLQIMSTQRMRHQRRHSEQRLFRLRQLVDQHTILLFVMASSTLVWLLLMLLDDLWWFVEVVWIVTINTVCIWLMLKQSQKYWMLLSDGCRCTIGRLCSLVRGLRTVALLLGSPSSSASATTSSTAQSHEPEHHHPLPELVTRPVGQLSQINETSAEDMTVKTSIQTRTSQKRIVCVSFSDAPLPDLDAPNTLDSMAVEMTEVHHARQLSSNKQRAIGKIV